MIVQCQLSTFHVNILLRSPDADDQKFNKQTELSKRGISLRMMKLCDFESSFSCVTTRKSFNSINFRRDKFHVVTSEKIAKHFKSSKPSALICCFIPTWCPKQKKKPGKFMGHATRVSSFLLLYEKGKVQTDLG